MGDAAVAAAKAVGYVGAGKRWRSSIISRQLNLTLFYNVITRNRGVFARWRWILFFHGNEHKTPSWASSYWIYYKTRFSGTTIKGILRLIYIAHIYHGYTCRLHQDNHYQFVKKISKSMGMLSKLEFTLKIHTSNLIHILYISIILDWCLTTIFAVTFSLEVVAFNIYDFHLYLKKFVWILVSSKEMKYRSFMTQW